MLPLPTVQATVRHTPHFYGVPTGEHLVDERIVIPALIARMGLLERLPVLGKNLLKNTPRPGGCEQHRRPPSQEVAVVVIPWLYHGSSTLSTPPQGEPERLPHQLPNYLQINGKKCI